MTIFTALTDLFIRPLELLFELFYSLAFSFLNNQAHTIFFLSLVVNILVLPLYQKADAIQEQARLKDQKLSPMVKHIKKNFSGDERFMILQTYYRQNDYKPTDVLKGSMSLLLEIPFFMAAYRFLSNLDMLQNASFGPISNLGAPDALLVLGGITINVLPIAMTMINLISSYIYMKGFPLKSKIQIYVMALIFLVLLYDSPSGLVFYWTLNNLFSLIKNIVYKLVKPERVTAALISFTGILAQLFFIFVHPSDLLSRQILAIGGLMLLQLPLVYSFAAERREKPEKAAEETAQDRIAFLLGGLTLSALTGLLIPSAVIANSPTEFINSVLLQNPIWHVMSSALIAIGTFVVWPCIFYMLAAPRTRKILTKVMWVLTALSVVGYMIFGKGYGNLSPNMVFDVVPAPARQEKIINLVVLLAVACVMIIIWRKKEAAVKLGYTAAILALVGMGLANLPGIYRKGTEEIAKQKVYQSDIPSIPLSKNGRNVVVLMMDRAIGAYIPYILQEKPEIAEQFQGFTYYPNTLSHGMNTNIGAPGLLGGYEYTPAEMNLDAERTLQQKHDEASMVLPAMFVQEGYQVTLMDSPNLGYGVEDPKSVFADYPSVAVHEVMSRYENTTKEEAEAANAARRRNLFCYSLFKISPVCLQKMIYAGGSYNDPDAIHAKAVRESGLYENGQIVHGMSSATGLNPVFMNAYRELEALPQLTKISDDANNTYLFLANNVPHESMLLKEPEYIPEYKVDNNTYDMQQQDRFIFNGHRMNVVNALQMGNYHTNMAGMIQLGKWFDFLRENDVYDNTRIIVVSDHGRNIGHFTQLVTDEEDPINILNYNALLMVKDFGSDGQLTMDESFMTNADVPTLAIDGLLENNRNPFTGRPIDSSQKESSQIVLKSMEHCGANNTPFYKEGIWYRAPKNIFDASGWEFISGPGVVPEN